MNASRAHSMLPVLERRESQMRRALEQASMELAVQRKALAALDAMLLAIDSRVATLHNGATQGATFTAATLHEVSQSITALGNARTKLVQKRQMTQRSLETAELERRDAARQWHMSRERLEHVRKCVRRSAAIAVVRTEESEHSELAISSHANHT
jgi:septal ring factor EnvC (AmiA/AmiB activator)